MRNLPKKLSEYIHRWIRNASTPKVCFAAALLVIATWAIFAAIIMTWFRPADAIPQFLVTSLATMVAIASVMIAAGGVLVSNRRQRRHETLRAYEAWSDKSVQSMILMAAHINPMEHLTETRLKILLNPRAASKKDLRQHLKCNTPEEAIEIIRSIRWTLNGLERLAVGVYESCYDETTLRQIGGSGIVDMIDRYSLYISTVKEGKFGHKASPRAYQSISTLTKELKRQIDKEEQRRTGQVRQTPLEYRW